MNPLLIIGSNGQVGKALRELAPDAVALGREECNLEALERFTPSQRPAAIINAAAYTAVDRAEEEEARAHQVNAIAPEILARYCREQGIPFVHYSTDYVFDGSGTAPWKESDATAPLNAYGRSKREGEMRIEAVGGKYLIFRTSWVYDETGKNFLNTMLRLGAERDELKVVNDQFGAPTYARHLAIATLQALENANNSAAFPSGIYHLCGGGETSWAGFAEHIFHLSHWERSKDAQQLLGEGKKTVTPSPDSQARRPLPEGEVKVCGIPASSYPTPAKRPYNSRLDCSKARRLLGVALPDWREGLRECLACKQTS